MPYLLVLLLEKRACVICHQVLERRTDEGSPERKRLAARRALRERKADEAYEDWVRQTRDRAYVEYKLEDR